MGVSGVKVVLKAKSPDNSPTNFNSVASFVDGSKKRKEPAISTDNFNSGDSFTQRSKNEEKQPVF